MRFLLALLSLFIFTQGVQAREERLSSVSTIQISEPKGKVKRVHAVDKENATELDIGYYTKDIPAVLSESDVSLYKKMFRFQRNRQRTQVANLVPKLEDRTLMGHLIAIRLLHPYTKSPYTDLKGWLSKYKDHSPASQIYKLANKRKPRGSWHQKPDFSRASIAKYSDPDRVRSGSGVRNTKSRKDLIRKLKYYRQKQYYTKAMNVLAKDSTFKMLGENTWAQVSLKLTRTMFHDGYHKKAQDQATRVVRRTKLRQSEALWWAGFSAYNRGSFEQAVGMFRRLAYSVPKESKYFSQSAWWAAKSYDELERGNMARVFYRLATKDPYSFYGQMASERIKKEKVASWTEPRIKQKDVNFLMKDAVIRRVVALSQIGEHGLAQQELKLIHERVPYDMDESLLALSLQLDLPNTAMTLARNLREQGKTYLVGLYPDINKWAPRGGFKVDKALVKAIARQESAFNPYVVSRAGARGLMQLMPNTAKFIRRKQNRPVYSRTALLNPKINMMLGQDYLMMLEEELEGNLLHMVAGYNAGPGNVKKWLKKDLGKNDPMLFIESIPFGETRKYVKYVFSNMWMYRDRYEERAPGLTAMANDLWPIEVAGSLYKRSASR